MARLARFVTFNEITLPVIDNFEKASAAAAEMDDQSENRSNGNSNSNSKGVYKIAGDRDIEAVYSDMKVAYEEMVIAELLQLTEELLTAENRGDVDTYNSLVQSGCTVVLNAVDPLKSAQTMSNMNVFHPVGVVKPHVRVMGKSAVVSCTRQFSDSACEETRVWQLDDEGLWKNVHLHRVMLL